eukprot:6103030-Pleurochrysis_carterae.AAC.2
MQRVTRRDRGMEKAHFATPSVCTSRRKALMRSACDRVCAETYERRAPLGGRARAQRGSRQSLERERETKAWPVHSAEPW